MADLVFLSYRLRGFDAANMLAHFERVLRAFPFSRSAPVISTLRVQALDWAEPPLMETAVEGPLDPEAAVEAAREFMGVDCACFVHTHWDLWQPVGGEWRLKPAPVTLGCFGPEFEEDSGDHLRIELGLDLYFLPDIYDEKSRGKIHSNLQSVVRLAKDLDKQLPVESRRLWTESGENFARRVEEFLAREVW